MWSFRTLYVRRWILKSFLDFTESLWSEANVVFLWSQLVLSLQHFGCCYPFSPFSSPPHLFFFFKFLIHPSFLPSSLTPPFYAVYWLHDCRENGAKHPVQGSALATELCWGTHLLEERRRRAEEEKSTVNGRERGKRLWLYCYGLFFVPVVLVCALGPLKRLIGEVDWPR